MKLASIRNLLVLLFLIVLASCSKVNFSVARTLPAEIYLPGVTTLAVGETEGYKSQDFAEEINSAIYKTGRFKLVDRTHLKRLMEEHSLNASGAVNAKSAAQLGNLTGASALIFGSVIDQSFDQKMIEPEVPKETAVNDSTKKASPPKYKAVGTAKFSAVLKIVDLNTGEILVVKTLSGSSSQTFTLDKPKKVNFNKVALFQQARTKVVQEFVRALVPNQVSQSVTLLKDGDMPELEKGIKEIKAFGDWKSGEQIFLKAKSKYDGKKDYDYDKVWYNLGVTYGFLKEWEKSYEHLRQAYRINDEDLYQQQVNVVKSMQRDDETLKMQSQGQ